MPSIQISEEAGVRSLHFGSSWVQGAMRVARPFSLELEYTREMMAALLLHPEAAWPARVLQVGLGAASLTKFLWRHRPECRQTVIEINPEVVFSAYAHFRLPDDPARIRIEIADAADFIPVDEQRYDLILVDGFDGRARMGRLDDRDFYGACRERLSRDGLMVVNLLGRNRGFQASVARISAAFDGRALAFPSGDDGNAIVFAVAGDTLDIPLSRLKADAEHLKKHTGLKLQPTLARLEQAVVCRSGTLTI